MAATLTPEDGDVVVRQKRGNPSTVYLLGTPSTPEQFILRSRDEAVAQALAFAKRQRVRAWFANGTDEFVLLGTFRKDDAETSEVIVTAKSATRKTDDGIRTAADRSAKALTDAVAQVTEHDIARRAYDLYLARGGEHGHHVEDWLQAERELRHSPPSSAGSGP